MANNGGGCMSLGDHWYTVCWSMQNGYRLVDTSYQCTYVSSHVLRGVHGVTYAPEFNPMHPRVHGVGNVCNFSSKPSILDPSSIHPRIHPRSNLDPSSIHPRIQPRSILDPSMIQFRSILNPSSIHPRSILDPSSDPSSIHTRSILDPSSIHP